MRTSAPGSRSTKRAQHLGQPLVGGGALRRHAHRLSTAVDDLADVALRGAQLAEGDARGPQHPATRSVGDEAATAAIEQRGRQAFLESDQALAQRGLAHVEVLGGGRQRLVAGERVE